MIKYFCDACETDITNDRGFFVAITENGKRTELNVCEDCVDKVKRVLNIQPKESN